MSSSSYYFPNSNKPWSKTPDCQLVKIKPQSILDVLYSQRKTVLLISDLKSLEPAGKILTDGQARDRSSNEICSPAF